MILAFIVFIFIVIFYKTYKNYQKKCVIYNIYKPHGLISVIRKKSIPTKVKTKEIKEREYPILINKEHEKKEEKIFENIENFVIDVEYDFEPTDVILNNNIDSQNVHDNKIQRVFRKKFQDLQETQEPHNRNVLFMDIIENSPEKYKKSTKDLLNHITIVNSSMIGYDGKSVSEIIEKTYKNLKTDDDKLFFYQNLEDCFEKGRIVCPTGIVSRILSTHFLKNPEKFPKGENEIFQEMLNNASIIRNDQDTDEEFKNKLLKKFSQDYKDILQEDEISKKVNEICDNL
jgi:hypothetical protein